MLEVWATLKVWFGFIIPAIIIVVIILVIFCSCFIKSILWNRKIKWLQANGFERYLVGVPSFGNGAFYGWRNKRTGKRIDERDLEHTKFTILLDKMKE